MTGDIDILRKKLIYKSHYRGCKENDLLLDSFIKKHIDEFNFEELQTLNTMLDKSDLDIFTWFTKKENSLDKDDNKITKILKNFSYCNN